MKFRTLSDFDFRGKRVLLRADLNSPVVSGKVLMNPRISASAKTIRELKRAGASVVVMAHQSRKGKKDFISLKQHSKLLEKFVKVKFVPDVFGKKARSAIENLGSGEVLLLDNVRFVKEEFSPSIRNRMVVSLKGYFDFYLNDAFSVSHRNQTSIVSFAKVLESGVGRLMEHEIKSLEKVSLNRGLFILCGAKADENLLLMQKARNVLVGGLFGILCLRAFGKKVGASEVLLKSDLKHLRNLKRVVRREMLPVDFVVSRNGRRKVVSVDELPVADEIFDIGPKTVEVFSKRIRGAKEIFMKGPAGRCEVKEFCSGTKGLLKAIAASKRFSVLGGGHLSKALEEIGISKNGFGHISLSGGALARYVAGEKLVGLEVLKNEV